MLQKRTRKRHSGQGPYNKKDKKTHNSQENSNPYNVSISNAHGQQTHPSTSLQNGFSLSDIIHHTHFPPLGTGTPLGPWDLLTIWVIILVWYPLKYLGLCLLLPLHLLVF